MDPHSIIQQYDGSVNVASSHNRRTGANLAAGDGAFRASADHVHLDLGDDAVVHLSIDHAVGWPHALGGGGFFSAVPFLGQYWHPHVLGGRASGYASIGSERWVFDAAEIYAEKNWGAGCPERWRWGQAQGFASLASAAAIRTYFQSRSWQNAATSIPISNSSLRT